MAKVILGSLTEQEVKALQVFAFVQNASSLYGSPEKISIQCVHSRNDKLGVYTLHLRTPEAGWFARFQQQLAEMRSVQTSELEEGIPSVLREVRMPGVRPCQL